MLRGSLVGLRSICFAAYIVEYEKLLKQLCIKNSPTNKWKFGFFPPASWTTNVNSMANWQSFDLCLGISLFHQ